MEYPGGYDAERSIQAELLKTISLQADPEIMRYEVTDRIYGNTGGGCMVGTLAVRLPDLDKTIWINCNDEGVTITSAGPCLYHSAGDRVLLQAVQHPGKMAAGNIPARS